MEIEATVTLTYSLYKKLFRFLVFGGKHSAFLCWFLPVLFALAAVLTGLHTQTVLENGEDPFFSLYLCVLFAFLFLLTLLYQTAFPSLAYRRQQRLASTCTLLRFFPDRLETNSKGEGIDQQARFNYTVFYRIYDTRDAFYLLLSKRHGIALPKSALKAGDAQRLSTLLAKNLGRKYIRCK